MTKDTVTYTLTLTVTRPIRVEDWDDTIADATAWYVSRKAQAELERETLRALRTLDGDCDIECLTAELKEND
jgi:hypothetical protein